MVQNNTQQAGDAKFRTLKGFREVPGLGATVSIGLVVTVAKQRNPT